MKINRYENAKHPAWKVPMDLPGVKPEDYDVSIDSGRGSAGQQKPEDEIITPDKEDPARKQQKEHGQLPLHDEPIGGA